MKLFLLLTLLKLSLSVVIDCKYYFYDWNNWGGHYTCSASLEDVTTAGVEVTYASGSHLGRNENADVLAVEFSGQKTNFIVQGLVKQFPNMKELYVFRSDLKEILKPHFIDYGQLTTVSLSRNHIQTVPQDAFDYLKNLEYLSLSFNQLTSVPYLGSMPMLKGLYLFENSIESLEASDFVQNPGLRVIWLYQNKIRFIDPEVFTGNSRLTVLDLSSNRCIDHKYGDFDNEEFKEVLKTTCTKIDTVVETVQFNEFP